MIEATYLDCCLPDYFQGYSQYTLCTPVWHGITYQEAMEALQNEDIEHLPDTLSEHDIDNAIQDLFAGVNDMGAPADFAKYIEPDEDGEGDLVYLYIGFYSVE